MPTWQTGARRPPSAPPFSEPLPSPSRCGERTHNLHSAIPYRLLASPPARPLQYPSRNFSSAGPSLKETGLGPSRAAAVDPRVACAQSHRRSQPNPPQWAALRGLFQARRNGVNALGAHSWRRLGSRGQPTLTGTRNHHVSAERSTMDSRGFTKPDAGLVPRVLP